MQAERTPVARTNLQAKKFRCLELKTGSVCMEMMSRRGMGRTSTVPVRLCLWYGVISVLKKELIFIYIYRIALKR